MQRACLAALVAAGSGLAASGAGACRWPDAFRSAGLEAVVITYVGDTILSQGTTIPFTVVVSANGASVLTPHLTFASSDSTTVALTAGRDSLSARSIGRAHLIIRMESSALTDSLPTLSQALRVRP
jgi:hypothetical protein